MTERGAMYRAILMHPEDNTPRRIFADFLEDNGELELSEFVRVQVELEQTTKCSLTDYDLLFKRREGCRCCLLRIRERELFSAYGAEWFGENVGLDRPTPLQLSIAALAGCGWVVHDRGFPAHWYGSWSAWVGGDCERCESDPVGSAHRNACSGRIPGACETLAWRPTWNRPQPPGAVPLETVTLTTMPPWFTRLADGRWHEPTERAEFDSDNECKHVCELRWPGLTFHLPAN